MDSLLITLVTVHIGISYLFYKIHCKFSRKEGLGKFLIPFYNYYLLLRHVNSEPAFYILIMFGGSGIIAAAIGVYIKGIVSVTFLLLFGNSIGLLAKKLGKNFWLYAILTALPLLNVLALMRLAFDKSQAKEIGEYTQA
ncbi:hypothetical protein [Azotosporobacter soli]|uniref:hypothetical protein n=1 Tax=Azotosporobacter soli TaxID=3055040 RepID=UPI0031FE9531